MAAEPRRLAQLPGYDTAPDVYETPDLTAGDATDDATTIGTGLSSPRGKHPGPRNILSDTSADDFGSADDTEDTEDEEADEDGIVSRRRLYPARARSRFGAAAAGVDARGTDLSDRVDGRRQGLRAAAARRRRRRRDGAAEDEGSGEEGLAVRLARLRREAEECRVLAEKFKAESGKEEGKAAVEGDGKSGVEGDAEALNRLLASIEVPLASASRRGGMLRRRPPQPPGAGAEEGAAVAKKASENDSIAASGTEGDEAQSTATTLRQISAFDARLAALESALGVSSLDTPSGTTTTGDHATPAPLLPTLGLLDAQLATLASASSLARLDAASARIQALKNDARALHPAATSPTTGGPAAGTAPMSPITEHARANGVTSRAESEYDDAAEALPTDDAPTATLSPADLRQLRALYALLPTLQSLSPTAPALIARLRSLRTLHGAAVAAAGDLDAVSARQDALDAELASWKTGLEGVERAVREADTANGRNGTVVKGWVEGLEKRVEGLLGK